MIKKRFGEDFATKISGNIEIKAHEVVRRDARGGQRQRRGGPRQDRGERGERKPRERK